MMLTFIYQLTLILTLRIQTTERPTNAPVDCIDLIPANVAAFIAFWRLKYERITDY